MVAKAIHLREDSDEVKTLNELLDNLAALKGKPYAEALHGYVIMHEAFADLMIILSMLARNIKRETVEKMLDVRSTNEMVQYTNDSLGFIFLASIARSRGLDPENKDSKEEDFENLHDEFFKDILMLTNKRNELMGRAQAKAFEEKK